MKTDFVGSWRSEPHETEWGTLVTTITLDANGQFSWKDASAASDRLEAEKYELDGTWQTKGKTIILKFREYKLDEEMPRASLDGDTLIVSINDQPLALTRVN